MISIVFCVFVVNYIIIGSNSQEEIPSCKSTVTTVSGTHAPKGAICSGQLILNEDFHQFNHQLWKNEITFGGGGNNEFEWYVDDRHNSFIDNGKMVLRPSLTYDAIGDKMYNGHIVLNPCTNALWNGCEHYATRENIINPIRSARLHTSGSFAFKYGTMEISAKLPGGNWLWPALWLLPQSFKYGGWPRSGEIDLMESRGNQPVHNFGSTLHFGPIWNQDAWSTSVFDKHVPSNLDQQFHRYKVEWTPQHIKFFFDDQFVGEIPVGHGFWERGHFHGDNIWQHGSSMAPFDAEFYIIINLAIGGTNGYFPDNLSNKPWRNSQPNAHTAFWNGKNSWWNNWKLDVNNGHDASFIIDSVKVWAI